MAAKASHSMTRGLFIVPPAVELDPGRPDEMDGSAEDA
jgi:hypothetical protein